MKYLITILLVGTSIFLGAQEFSYGFKAGLNFSRFQGPLEESNGNELEENKFRTGYHIGANFDLKFTDQLGARSGLFFSQMGTEYTFNGQSFWVFYSDSDQKVYGLGNRNTILSVTNSYVEIPLMAVGRFGRIELSAGLTGAILTGSKGSGEIVFTGQTLAGSNIASEVIEMDYNYQKDAYLESKGEDRMLSLDGKNILLPDVIGAYYEGFDNEEKAFNRFDVNVGGGAAFFLNSGMYFAFTFKYGLLDVTNNEQDHSLTALNDSSELIPRDDIDKNIAIQASVGFKIK